MTDRNGFTKNGKKASQISVAEAEEFFKKHKADIPDNMVSKFEHCIRACQHGVSRVHMIDGRIDEALLTEIFSNEALAR